MPSIEVDPSQVHSIEVDPSQVSAAPAAGGVPEMEAPIKIARQAGTPDEETLDYIGRFRPDLAPRIKQATSAGRSASDVLNEFAGASPEAPKDATARFVSNYAAALNPFPALKHYLADVPQQEGDAIHEKLSNGDYMGAFTTILKAATPGSSFVPDAVAAQAHQFVKAYKDLNDSKQMPNVSDRLLSAGGHAAAGLVPFVGPAAANAGEQIGSGDVAGGLGSAAGLVTGVAAGPLLEKTGAASAPPLAENAASLYRSALKPSTKLEPEAAAETVQTGLQNRIPISDAGLVKLRALISNLGDQVNDRIAAGTRRGVTIDPAAAAQRADQVRSQFATQVNPTADVAAIDASKQEFLKQHTTPGRPPTTLYNAQGQPMQVGGTPAAVNPIPADQAMSVVRGTYRKLSKSYGELKGAEIEAQKALTRGIKEELQQQFPELKQLTEKQWKFLQLEPELEKAINRNANKEPVGLLPAMAIDTATTGGHAVVAGVLAKLVSSPRIRARLAMGLDMAAKAKGGAAVGRALPAAAAESRAIGSNQRIEAFLAALKAASEPATGAQ